MERQKTYKKIKKQIQFSKIHKKRKSHLKKHMIYQNLNKHTNYLNKHTDIQVKHLYNLNKHRNNLNKRNLNSQHTNN